MSQPLWTGGQHSSAPHSLRNTADYGLGALVESIITEELGRGSQTVALIHDVRTALTSAPIEMSGTPEQERKCLSRCSKGTICFFGLTEAEHGSNSAYLKTTAEVQGQHVVINGNIFWDRGDGGRISRSYSPGSRARWSSGHQRLHRAVGRPGRDGPPYAGCPAIGNGHCGVISTMFGPLKTVQEGEAPPSCFKLGTWSDLHHSIIRPL